MGGKQPQKEFADNVDDRLHLSSCAEQRHPRKPTSASEKKNYKSVTPPTCALKTDSKSHTEGDQEQPREKDDDSKATPRNCRVLLNRFCWKQRARIIHASPRLLFKYLSGVADTIMTLICPDNAVNDTRKEAQSLRRTKSYRRREWNYHFYPSRSECSEAILVFSESSRQSLLSARWWPVFVCQMAPMAERFINLTATLTALHRARVGRWRARNSKFCYSAIYQK